MTTAKDLTEIGLSEHQSRLIAQEWRGWTPTLSMGGTGSLSSTAIEEARYYQLGQAVWAFIGLTTTVTGSVNQISFSLPVEARDFGVGNNNVLIGHAIEKTTNLLAFVAFNPSGFGTIAKNAGANFTTGSIRVLAQVMYEAA